MVTSKKKKKKNKEEESKQTFNKYDALQARLKLRRGLLGLFMLMKQKLSHKNRDQIHNSITFCLKTLEVIKDTMEYSANMEKAFSDTINKTLLCHIPPRKIEKLGKQEAITEVEEMLNNFTCILELTHIKDFYDIQRALESYALRPKNIITRAYLDINIFFQDTYFG